MGSRLYFLTFDRRDKLNLDIFWLKDESLEDSANLSGLYQSRVPGFPRHSQSLSASRRKAGSRYPRAASARRRHHWQSSSPASRRVKLVESKPLSRTVPWLEGQLEAAGANRAPAAPRLKSTE